jgi:hypothetical protein
MDRTLAERRWKRPSSRGGPAVRAFATTSQSPAVDTASSKSTRPCADAGTRSASVICWPTDGLRMRSGSTMGLGSPSGLVYLGTLRIALLVIQ